MTFPPPMKTTLNVSLRPAVRYGSGEWAERVLAFSPSESSTRVLADQLQMVWVSERDAEKSDLVQVGHAAVACLRNVLVIGFWRKC